MAKQAKYFTTIGFLLVISCAIILTLLFSYLAAGQGFTSPTQLKGTRDAEIWTGGVVAQHDGTFAFNTDIWMGGARLGRILTAPHGQGWIRGTLEWNFDLIPVFVVFHPQTAYGGEFDPVVLRWNFIRKGKTAPYAEMAGGVVFTNSNVPPGDTSKFNVVPKIGLGWQIFTGPQHSLDIGLHAWHLSNAWTGPRNPSVNGLQLTLGYHWFKLQRNQRTGSGDMHENEDGDRP